MARHNSPGRNDGTCRIATEDQPTPSGRDRQSSQNLLAEFSSRAGAGSLDWDATGYERRFADHRSNVPAVEPDRGDRARYARTDAVGRDGPISRRPGEFARAVVRDETVFARSLLARIMLHQLKTM